MRILHLPYNIASQIEIMVDAFRQSGVEARGLVNKSSAIHSSQGLEDVSRARSTARRFTPRWFSDRILGTTHVCRAIQWADVVHYHYGGATALPSNRDLRWSSMLNRRRLVTFWGTDIRNPEIEARDNPYYARVWNDQPTCTPRESRERSLRTQELYATFGFHCVLGGDDMIAYVSPEIFPTYTIIRCGIRLDNLLPEYPNQERRRPTLVHSPSDTTVKGTAAVLAAVETLRRRKLDFDFIFVNNVARSRALSILRSADLFLDQFVLGAHGMASVEAMATGKPVVCFIKPSIPYPEDLPIVNATQDTLADVLEQLILDGSLRHDLGLRSRRYAEKYHDAREIARQLLELYGRLAR